MLSKTLIGFTIASGICAMIIPASSYFRTGARLASNAAEQQMPMDFSIAHLETRIHDLDSLLEDQQHRILSQEVERDAIQRDATQLADDSKRLEKTLSQIRHHISIGDNEVQFAGRQFTKEELFHQARQLTSALERCRNLFEAKNESARLLDHAIAEAKQHIHSAEQQRLSYSTRLETLRAQAENVAIRSSIQSHINDLPNLNHDAAYDSIENSFAKLEKQVETQRRQLDRSHVMRPNLAGLDPLADDAALLEHIDSVLAANSNDKDSKISNAVAAKR